MAAALQPVAGTLHCLLPLLTDTHCHMAGYSMPERREFCCQAVEQPHRARRPNGAKHYVVVSVVREDWESAARIDHPQFRAAFGVHPQCAMSVEPEEVQVGEGCAHGRGNSGFLSELRSRLAQRPRAIVGEIGLDRNRANKWSYDEYQVPLLVSQVRVAAELHRPVSVHSVQADGELVRVLREEAKAFRPLPPKVCLHSFAGSLETLQAILAAVEKNCPEDAPVRVFVGFNAWTNLFKKQAASFVRAMAGKGEARPGCAVKGIRRGRERFLLESDWNTADFDFRGSHRQDIDKILLNGVLRLAELLEETPEEVAALLASNTEEFMDSWVEESSARAGADQAEAASSSCSEEEEEDGEEETDEEEKEEEDDGDPGLGAMSACSQHDVEAMQLGELRTALKARGLSARGTRHEQRQRLLDHDMPTAMVPDFKAVLRELDLRL